MQVTNMVEFEYREKDIAPFNEIVLLPVGPQEIGL